MQFNKLHTVGISYERIKSLGIEGEYPEGAKRKDNWVYYVE